MVIVCTHALGEVMGHDAVSIWHQDTDLQGRDAIVLPGGFSYGDYLPACTIARFASVMSAIKEFAKCGGLMPGICNDFQILLEAGMLSGTMLRNASLEFRSPGFHVLTHRWYDHASLS
jgi:phosphoribosylformylglycinamidine synthase subunit PurQ / glutaminase